MDTILITGGTGLIGTELTRLLISKGYRVIVLTRSEKPSDENVSYSLWDPQQSLIDLKAISEADHIIHLAGAGIGDKRWTKKRKEEILSSRLDGSRLLIEALRKTDNKVQTIVSAAAIGWYGPDTKGSKRAFVETDPSYKDFLGETCRRWEESIMPVTEMNKRLVILRAGMVLSNNGGAFPEFVKPMKAGIAAILGSGKQVVSWIHIDDICRLYVEAIENKNIKGIYNAVAPGPVTNKELVIGIARARQKPFIPVHVPALALKIYLGELRIEVLKSADVDSGKIRQSGFKFIYPTFEAAVNSLVHN